MNSAECFLCRSSARSLTIVVGDHDKSLGSPNEASHSIERIIMVSGLIISLGPSVQESLRSFCHI